MKHKDVDAMIADLVRSSDFHTTYLILCEVAICATVRWTIYLDCPPAKIGLTHSSSKRARPTAIRRVSCLEEHDRQMNIIGKRNTITGEEHRFFLALLLNVSNREKILELLKRRFPETDPARRSLIGWSYRKHACSDSRNTTRWPIDGLDDQYIVVLQKLGAGEAPDANDIYANSLAAANR